MRIIGGASRGRTILSPKGMKVRPTPDMVREALFNILDSMKETSFLDLYAGTGSVGLEALSRGASRVVFVEKNSRMAMQILDMLKAFDFSARADVLALDVRSGISRLSKTHEKFDIIFADPPYEKELLSKTMQYCLDSGLMADEGLMVMQHAVREPLRLLSHQDCMTLIQERRYGDTLVSFLRFHMKEH